jgi:exopolysaccharide production protein ExoZ
MLYFLQALRGVAAFLVMLFHYRGFLDGVYSKANFSHAIVENGYMGVDIFFVISGFIIVYSTRKKEHAGCIDFIIRRFFRVVPLAWIATLTFYFLEGAVHSNTILLRSLMFIPLKNEDPPYFGYSLLGVVWTISYELFFYLMFSIALAFSHRFRTLLAGLLIGACIYIFQAVLTGGFSLNAHQEPLPDFTINWLPVQVLALFGNPLSLDFVVGMILGEAYIRYAEKLGKCRAITIQGIALLFFAIFLYYYFAYTGVHGQGLLTIGAGAVYLVIGCLLLDIAQKGNRPRKGFWFFLGAVSYPLYLVHNGITDRLVQRLPRMYAAISTHKGLLAYLIYGCISIALAAWVHWFLELPLQNLGKRIIRWRASRQARAALSIGFAGSAEDGWSLRVKAPLAIIAGLSVAMLGHHMHDVQSTNLMPENSSFELGLAGWTPGTADIFETSSAEVVDGRLSAHIVTSGMRFVESHRIPLERGRRYRIDVWVYIKKGAARIQLIGGPARISLAEAHDYVTNGWVCLTAITKDPLNNNLVTLCVDDYHEKSEFYIDAVRLRPQW